MSVNVVLITLDCVRTDQVRCYKRKDLIAQKKDLLGL